MYTPLSSAPRAVANINVFPRRRSARLKRALDLGLTLLGLVGIWPLLLLTALAIRIDTCGPVFFVQTRVGKDGKPFGMIKFRSMYADAEARRADLLAKSDREGICFKAKDDPRITRVGRFLRRSSLDELPQIFNVLRGEMSLVGPRPALPEEVSAYPTPALERLSVLPGITGPWQISGRADLSFDQMLRLDISYARGGSIAQDIEILIKTVKAVATGKGAY